MKIYIGIDLGTSSLKATAINEKGKVLATASKNTTLIAPLPDFAEQDPTMWWKYVVELINTLGKKINKADVQGIGLSGQMHGLVMYDTSDELLGNAIVWLDKRSQKQVNKLKRRIGERKWYSITGNPLFTGFLLPSLLWIKENDQKLYSKIKLVSSPKDYLAYRLTGVIRTEPTDALATGAYDYKQNTWSEYLLKVAGISKEIFPQVKPTSSPYGTITQKVAKETGLPQGIPVFGASDQAMAAMGIGLIKEKQASIAISTGGQFLVIGKKGLTDKKRRLHTLNHALPGIGLYQGATLVAGLSLSWFKNALFGSEYPFEELLADVTPQKSENNSLFFLPFLAGERTPYFNPNLKGAFIGLTLSHGKKDFVKAILEGVGYSMKECLEVFKDMDIFIDRIILSGGGTKHTIWAQIMANILDMPIEIINIENHSPYGAAIVAKFAQEDFKGIEEFYKKLIEPILIVMPNKEYVAIYEKQFKEYRKHAKYMNKATGGSI